MAEFKLVIGTKEGKCVQKEVKEADANVFLNKKIGDKISGDECGLAGYELEITGGSDNCGFPIRKDVQGAARKRILAVKGVGLKKKGKGLKIRKTVRGNLITDNISQINLKVLKEGKEKLGAAKKEESKEGEAPAEAKKEAPKEEEKEEKPKEEKKPEAPKEEKKEEKPAEKPKEEKPKEEKPAEKKE